MKVLITPNTTGGYENSLFQNRKIICCFSKNLWIRSKFKKKKFLPDICVVNIIDKLFKVLCGCFLQYNNTNKLIQVGWACEIFLYSFITFNLLYEFSKLAVVNGCIAENMRTVHFSDNSLYKHLYLVRNHSENFLNYYFHLSLFLKRKLCA